MTTKRHKDRVKAIKRTKHRMKDPNYAPTYIDDIYVGYRQTATYKKAREEAKRNVNTKHDD